MKIQNGTLKKSNAFTTHPKEKYQLKVFNEVVTIETTIQQFLTTNSQKLHKNCQYYFDVYNCLQGYHLNFINFETTWKFMNLQEIIQENTGSAVLVLFLHHYHSICQINSHFESFRTDSCHALQKTSGIDLRCDVVIVI